MKAILNSVCINEPSAKCFAACKINIMGNSQLPGPSVCPNIPGGCGVWRDGCGCLAPGPHRAGCSHPQNVEQESGGRGNRGGRCVGMEVSPWQEAPQLASREGKGKGPQDGNSFLW